MKKQLPQLKIHILYWSLKGKRVYNFVNYGHIITSFQCQHMPKARATDFIMSILSRSTRITNDPWLSGAQNCLKTQESLGTQECLGVQGFPGTHEILIAQRFQGTHGSLLTQGFQRTKESLGAQELLRTQGPLGLGAQRSPITQEFLRTYGSLEAKGFLRTQWYLGTRDC